MRKPGLINLLKQVAVKSEEEEIDDLRPLEVINLLLDYINDNDIREAVDEILM